MRTENQAQTQQSHLSEGMPLIFKQESAQTLGSSRSSSRSSSSSSSDRSYSSSGTSRSPSVSRRSQRRQRHGSRCSSSSSSSSRSRSYPRCCRASEHSRCRHRSRSYSPYSRHSSRYGRRRSSRSISRSSSRENDYRKSRRSRSRSSSYKRTRGYAGRFRGRFSPSPVRSYYRRKPKSPERSVWLSQKDKLDLLNIARENAAKILGVEVVKLPASVRCIEEQVKKAESDPEKRVRADPAPGNTPRQDEDKADDDLEFSRTSPARKPISFSVSNAVAKPSSSPTLHITESKVTSRADSVGNRKPYGQWIPVKTVSTKKR